MILLDTHVLVRYVQDDRRIGKRARSTIDRALRNDEARVSAVTFWELGMLLEKKRLVLDVSASAFRTLTLQHGLREEALDGAIGITAAELPGSHNDPADRMIVATAMVRGLGLVTADEVLLDWKLSGYRAIDATA